MSLDSDCLARLKLRHAPFDTLTSEDFLYSDPLLESLIETAARALKASGAVVVLAGPDGSGRSIQLMRLLGVLDGEYELIAFRGRPNIPFDAVDVTIRAHLQRTDLDEAPRPIAELLAERTQAQARLVLAIDDAHLLGSDGLVKLVRLRATVLERGGQGLRLILVGDPTLSRGRLPLPDLLDDSQVVRLNLRPFNLEQAGAYLRHRLRVAGLDDPDSLLSKGDIAVLQGSAKGLPAALNAQANAWLARRCKSLDNGLKSALSARLTAAVVTTAAATHPAAATDADATRSTAPESPFELAESDESFQDVAADTYTPAATAPPKEPYLSDFLVNGNVPTALAQNEFEQILQRVRQHQPWEGTPEPKAASREEIQASAPPTPVQYWNRPWFIPAIVGLVLAAVAVPVIWQLVRDTQPAISLDAPDAPDVPAPPETAPSTPPEPITAPLTPPPTPLDAAAAAGGLTDAPPLTAAAPPLTAPITPLTEPPPVAELPAAETVTPPDPAVSASALNDDLDWLQRQNPDRFTIQLVAARDLATARTVLEPQALEGVRYIQTRSYVIAILGSFPSRTQAARELPALPAPVRDNGPWIRTIGSIRDSLP